MRVLYAIKPNHAIHHLYILLLVVGVFALLLQGNYGGQLVYDYGLGVSR
jgi:uncharacterized membrane protein